MKDLQWNLMLEQLKGSQFSNYGLNQLAQLNIGPVINQKQYTILTDRLYIPTKAEKFAAL